LLTLFVLVLFIWAIWEARDWQIKARLFPWLIGIPALVLTFMQLVLELAGRGTGRGLDMSIEGSTVEPAVERRRTTAIALWILGFFLVLYLLGFLAAVPLFVFLYLKVDANEKWLTSLLIAGACWGFLYLLFVRMLHTLFFKGQLLGWLGW
jgi:hypothetical protein